MTRGQFRSISIQCGFDSADRRIDQLRDFLERIVKYVFQKHAGTLFRGKHEDEMLHSFGERRSEWSARATRDDERRQDPPRPIAPLPFANPVRLVQVAFPTRRRSSDRRISHQSNGVVERNREGLGDVPISHRLCRLIWKILHQGIWHKERGPAVNDSLKQARTRKMIREPETAGGYQRSQGRRFAATRSRTVLPTGVASRTTLSTCVPRPLGVPHAVKRCHDDACAARDSDRTPQP
jgi:hypothetical protein